MFKFLIVPENVFPAVPVRERTRSALSPSSVAEPEIPPTELSAPKTSEPSEISSVPTLSVPVTFAIPAPSFLSVPAPETALPKAKFSAVSVSVVVSERIAVSSTEILPEEPSACAFFRTREPPVTDAVPSKEALVPAKICVPAPLLTRFKLFRNCPWNVYSLLSAVSISSVRTVEFLIQLV